jgi:transcriptional regulator with XRE-family HTH domain
VPSQYRIILAANVRKHRKKLGLSQEALGERSKMPDVYISKIERAELDVGIDNIERLASALGLSVPELLTSTEA